MKSQENIFNTVWRGLTQPHQAIQEKYQQRRARIISAVLFILWLIFIFNIFVESTQSVVIISAILLSLPYGLSRTRYFSSAVLVATAILAYSIIGRMANADAKIIDVNAYLQWFVVPMILGSLLLAPRQFAVLVGLIIGICLVLKGFFPAIEALPFWGAVSYVGTIGSLMLVASFVQEHYLFHPQIQEIETAQSALLAKNKELDDLNHSLEKRVQERTQALETALQQAHEASRVKSEFLSVMSHELRTPLNAIIGYQELVMLSNTLDEDNETMLKHSLQNADRLLMLINDMLDLNRLEIGSYTVKYACVHLRNFVDKFEKQMAGVAKQKYLGLQITLDPQLPELVRLDEDILYKIMFHLVSNAIKFTEAGTVYVSLTKINQQIRLVVQDSGIGIPTEMHRVIFENFRQVDSSTRRRHGGSGLGLSIVKQLTEILNGRIEVSSELNRGSTFTVCLPLLQ